MGSPKKQKKKFSKPSHPWQKERILAEKDLLKTYGLRRKYEIWKMNSILKNFTNQAKNLITTKKQQSDKERTQMLTKLSSLGFIESNSKVDDVLSLTLKDVMERRLQTLVFRKNLARNIKQARQFIVHEHISIGNKTITAPSYLVHLKEEGNIQFAQSSAFIDPNHPERLVEIKEVKKTKVKETEDKEQLSKKDTEKKKPEKEAKIKKSAKQDKETKKKQEAKEDKKEEKKIETKSD